MRYKVLISAEEAKTLMTWIGKPLDRVASDGWSAAVQAAGQNIQIVPEEIHTPDESHPFGTGERPKIILTNTWEYSDKVVGSSLGNISAISIAHTITTFSQVRQREAFTLPNGVVMPEGKEYSVLHYHPESAKDLPEDFVRTNAVIDLDEAVLFSTDKGHHVWFYTRGYFINVVLDGELPSYLERTVELLPIAIRVQA